MSLVTADLEPVPDLPSSNVAERLPDLPQTNNRAELLVSAVLRHQRSRDS